MVGQLVALPVSIRLVVVFGRSLDLEAQGNKTFPGEGCVAKFKDLGG